MQLSISASLADDNEVGYVHTHLAEHKVETNHHKSKVPASFMVGDLKELMLEGVGGDVVVSTESQMKAKTKRVPGEGVAAQKGNDAMRSVALAAIAGAMATLVVLVTAAFVAFRTTFRSATGGGEAQPADYSSVFGSRNRAATRNNGAAATPTPAAADDNTCMEITAAL
jgi:hypothetical protein